MESHTKHNGADKFITRHKRYRNITIWDQTQPYKHTLTMYIEWHTITRKIEHVQSSM